MIKRSVLYIKYPHSGLGTFLDISETIMEFGEREGQSIARFMQSAGVGLKYYFVLPMVGYGTPKGKFMCANLSVRVIEHFKVG